MKEQSPQFINELKPVMVNGHERHQLADGSNHFVSKETAEQARENSEQALRDTVKELESYGHDVSQFDHEVMSKQMGLDSKPSRQWRKEIADDADPSAQEAEQSQHDERQAAYDELFAGKSDEDIDREVEAGGYRRRQREAEAKHKAEVEARASKHEERRKFKELEDVQKMSVTELAGLLGEKPDFKVAKSEYVARVKAKQQEAKDYKAPTVDLVTPAVKEPSESTKATIEAIKKFHKEMGGVETDETKLLYKKFIKEDVDAFLALVEKQKKEQLNPAEAIDLKLRAKLLEAADVEGDESTIEDGYDRAFDVLLEDYQALLDKQSEKGELSDEEALTLERLKLLLLDVNDKLDRLDGLSDEEREESRSNLVAFLDVDEESRSESGEDDKPLSVVPPVVFASDEEARPEQKSRKKKLLAAAAGILALVGIGALANRLGDDDRPRLAPPVETVTDDTTPEDTETPTPTTEATDDTQPDDDEEPVPAGEGDDDGESNEDDENDDEPSSEDSNEDEESDEDNDAEEEPADSNDESDDDEKTDEEARQDKEDKAEQQIVGAENFEVAAGSGIVQEIKQFAEANGFDVDDDQAFALYQAGLDEFGKDGLITGSTYEISPGNIGISEPGNSSWSPAFLQFMLDRMQPAANGELPSTE